MNKFLAAGGMGGLALEDDRTKALGDGPGEGQKKNKRAKKAPAATQKVPKSELDQKKDKVKQRTRALHTWAQDTKQWCATVSASKLPEAYKVTQIADLESWRKQFADLEERCQNLLLNFDMAEADLVLTASDGKRSEYLELVQTIKKLAAVKKAKKSDETSADVPVAP
jgi:hypothetical protein